MTRGGDGEGGDVGKGGRGGGMGWDGEGRGGRGLGEGGGDNWGRLGEESIDGNKVKLMF